MSKDEWAFHERFILTVRAPNGRKPTSHHLVLDGILWISRTGSPSRDLPEEFGKWSSVYRHFRRWTLARLWEHIMKALNESGLVPDALQMIDTTAVRAIIRQRAQKGGLAAGFGPIQGRLHDQNPPPRQRCWPADKIGHHSRPDFGISGLRSGHG